MWMIGLVPAMAVLGARPLAAQELDPGAYTISPVGVNVVVVSNTSSFGDVAFDPSGPIADASAAINTTVVAYGRSLGVAGRSASITAAVPYVAGRLEGQYLGLPADADRAGPADGRIRFAMNLYGGRAMTLKEFAEYRPRSIVGASVTVGVPIGQYSPERLINLGTNRWSFKPEVGWGRTDGPWTVEAYAGVWFFTANPDYFGGRVRRQRPIASAQVHLQYAIRPRLWTSFNANFYAGGRTTVGDRVNLDLQRNSRIGGTLSLPVGGRQTLKMAVSRGAWTTIGGDFTSFSAAYQFIWGKGL
jgi:hypothetical protein